MDILTPGSFNLHHWTLIVSPDGVNCQLLSSTPTIPNLVTRSSFAGRLESNGDCKCFNCLLNDFNCTNFGDCNQNNGKCVCPNGYGDEDCSKPGVNFHISPIHGPLGAWNGFLAHVVVCGSFADGTARPIKPPGDKTCQCSDGWSGLNCNGKNYMVGCVDSLRL